LGDRVEAGELLAELESKELAETKAECLAAKERLKLAEANLDREERLRAKKISTEKEHLEARQEKAKAEIELNLAEQRLRALGVSKKDVDALDKADEDKLTCYELRAPFASVVIQKHITLGEKLSGEHTPFVIADLSKVWVNLTVYQKDLGSIRIGHEAVISFGHGIPEARGKIDYISPMVEEATRTATARVILANTEGRIRPGLFVTSRLVLEKISAPVVVPRSAVLDVDGLETVFVRHGDHFEVCHVKLGRTDRTRVEILHGLNNGDTYVSSGAFALKAELGKKSFGAGGHGHGH
jgi:cobalt-zinc-cadmium efflux system membrane fusion protein